MINAVISIISLYSRALSETEGVRNSTTVLILFIFLSIYSVLPFSFRASIIFLGLSFSLLFLTLKVDLFLYSIYHPVSSNFLFF